MIAATACSKDRSETPKGSEVIRKNKMKKTKKQKKRHFFFVFLLITFLFFHRFQLSLLQKVAGVHSHRPCKDRLETPKGLGVIRKNKMKKETKKTKIRWIFGLFFAITFWSFNRFQCFWSLKVTRVALDFSRLRTRRNSQGFGSYEEKTKKLKAKKQKKRHFCFCFLL